MKRLAFGVVCRTCGTSVMMMVTGELAAVARRDPVQTLRMLPDENRRACIDFCGSHDAMGHSVEPILAELEELAKA